MEVEPKTESILAADIQKLISLGYDVSDLVDCGDYYIVEGDIQINKDYLQECSTQIGPDTKQWQYGVNAVIAVENQNKITVAIESALMSESNWYTAVLKAIEAWNSVPNCYIKMTYTTSPTADIVFKKDATMGDAVGVGGPPSNGKPFPTVRINTSYNYYQPGEKAWIAVHELGHCLGLRHTDWGGEPADDGRGNQIVYIPGTPESDPNSVMSKYRGNKTWPGFTSGDILAIQTLYPVNIRNMSLAITIADPGVGPYYFTGCIYNIQFYGTPSGTITSYEWYGDYINIVGGQGTARIQATPSTWGTYTIKCKVTLAGDSRLYEVSQTFFVHDQPVIEGPTSINIGEYGEYISYTAYWPSNGWTLTWDIDSEIDDPYANHNTRSIELYVDRVGYYYINCVAVRNSDQVTVRGDAIMLDARR